MSQKKNHRRSKKILSKNTGQNIWNVFKAVLRNIILNVYVRKEENLKLMVCDSTLKRSRKAN